jgi:hypothetical protein
VNGLRENCTSVPECNDHIINVLMRISHQYNKRLRWTGRVIRRENEEIIKKINDCKTGKEKEER